MYTSFKKEPTQFHHAFTIGRGAPGASRCGLAEGEREGHGQRKADEGHDGQVPCRIPVMMRIP